MITTSGGGAVGDLAELIDRLGLLDLDLAEGLFEHRADPGPDDGMVVHDQAARRSLHAGRHPRQHTSNSHAIPERRMRAWGSR